MYKVPVTPFVGPSGQLFGHDVGVYVDGKHVTKLKVLALALALGQAMA